MPIMKTTTPAASQPQPLRDADGDVIIPFGSEDDIPGGPEDDIPDPKVPQGVLAAPAQPTQQSRPAFMGPRPAAPAPVLQTPERPASAPEPPLVLTNLGDQVLLTIDQAMWKMSEHVVSGMRACGQAVDQGIAVLQAQHDGLRVLAEACDRYAPVIPYSVTIHVKSPSGYPMAFTVQESVYSEFLTAVGQIMQLCQEDGFTPGPS